jgi:serine/threonine protein kinase
VHVRRHLRGVDVAPLHERSRAHAFSAAGFHLPSRLRYHRDFKPANILLDEALKAHLADTGFVKVAAGVGASGVADDGASTRRICASPGFADKDVLNGATAATEGFAVGVTLLVVLTGRAPVDIEDACEEDHGDTPFDEIAPELLAEPGAGWPVEVATALKQLYTGLCVVKKRHRVKLPLVLQTLRRLLDTATLAMADTPRLPAAAAVNLGPLVQEAHGSYEPTPLSMQVRRMGAAAHSPRSAERLGRNVSAAFDELLGRLQTKLAGRRGAPDPKEEGYFASVLDFWRSEGLLPDGLHADMHTLRFGRNGHVHADQDKWRRFEQRMPSEADVLGLIERVDKAISELGTS